MTRGAFAPFLHYVRSRRRAADADATLLARFAADRDEDAFAELVRRHGPLVWGVARQVLGHEQDAEDAFQATFLLLARKAGSIQTATAGWLHATAFRVATRAKVRAVARLARERAVPRRVSGDPVADAALRELQTLLHEEIAALPAKYRTPFVSCILEGRSRTHIAAALGWNEGTVSSRLAWARRRLRKRLARRGVDVTAALAAIEVTRDATAAVPAALTTSAVTAARTGIASAAVAALAHGGFMTTRFAPLAALGLVLGVIAAGSAGLMGSDPPAQPAPKEKAAPQPAAARGARPTGTCSLTVTGTATGPAGKPVAGATVFLRLLNRDDKWVAPVTTDAQGRYEFKNLALPMAASISVITPPNREGVLQMHYQICAIAKGMAVEWAPEIRAPISSEMPGQGGEIHYSAGSSKVDVSLAPAAHFQGRLANDKGQPVAGAKIHMTKCGHLSTPPEPVELTPNLSRYLQTDYLPGDRTTATSGPEGQFRIDGVPADAIARFAISHPDYASLSATAALVDPRTAEPSSRISTLIPRNGNGFVGKIVVGDIDLTLQSPRSLTVVVVSNTTDKPVANAHVSIGAISVRSSRGPGVPLPADQPTSHASGVTDAAGRVVLKVPPGDYTLLAYAPSRVPGKPPQANAVYYPRYHEQMTIAADPVERTHTVRLDPACVIHLDVVDAATGKPVADSPLVIAVERNASPTRPNRQAAGRRDPDPELNWQRVDGEPVPSPRTDAQGQATAWAAPGTGRIRVNVNRASDYADFTTTEPMTLPAGGEVKLRVELQKKGPPAPPPQPPPLPPPPPQAARPKSVPVTGTASGPDSKPVAGATVYLVAKDGPHEPVIATTTTDDQGAFEFRDAQMLVTTIGVTASLPLLVHLQVCAAKPGLALAWHQRGFTFSIGTPVQTQRVKLTLGKPVGYPGRVLDDQGRPVAGAKVRLRGDFGAIVVGDLPDALIATRTGADGRFRLTNMPDELAQFEVTQPGFPDVLVFAVSPRLAERYRTDPNLPAYRLALYQVGEINVTLPSPRSIPVRVVAKSTGAPVKDAELTLSSERDAKIRLVSRGTTDADGRTMLRQPPGEYKLEMIMPVGTNYLNVPEKVTVQPEPAEQPLTVRLMDGCTVEIEAVDVATGIPLATVRFLQTLADKPNAWGSSHQYARGRDGPDVTRGSKGTDKWGKMTAVLPPGKYLFRTMPPFVLAEESKPIDLPEGGTVKLRIAVREVDLRQRP
jgi:RNA polymerase sigma factor (sigma-70 family)